MSDYADDSNLREALIGKYPAIAPHITGHRASDYGPNHVAEVDQIVASMLNPTGGMDFPSGSGYLNWLDDTIRIERPHYGFPSDLMQWAEDSGLPSTAMPYLSRVLDGATGGHELVVFSAHMPLLLQSPPYGKPEEFEPGSDEWCALTVIKRMSVPILPGETPIQVAQRIARTHIAPCGPYGQICHFSGPRAPKPYEDHDYQLRLSEYPQFHASDQLALFRRGAVFYAVPVCKDCGHGLTSHTEANGERAVFVAYTDKGI